MTRNDYELIARTIRSMVDDSTRRDGLVLRATVSRLSKELMTDNPRFDPDKFSRACGF